MDRYERGEKISQDGYPQIHKCIDRRTNLNFVVKSIPYESKDEGVPCSILREISVLRELSHRNVARLCNVCDDADGFHLVFEDLDLDLSRFIYGSLKSQLGLHVIKGFLFQILQGVSYCHSRKVLHRDLKPQILLINNNSNTLKLAEFGFTRIIDVPLSHYTITDVKTLSYKAPELLLQMRYSAAADIWSVGCIFAEMMNNQVLFPGTDEIDIMDNIFRTLDLRDDNDRRRLISSVVPSEALLQRISKIVPNLDPQGVDLLSKMLCVNPKHRITACVAMKHPYFDDLQENP